jgi:N-methylhydantoinase A/oxoprolinase/acetone carboxylase beta subunit
MSSAVAPLCAVSGKFSIRNPIHEQKVAAWLQRHCELEFLTIGSELSGSLNFLRRTNSAYFNSAVWRQFNKFADAVKEAVNERRITAPIYILKADGGTISS